MAFDIKTAKPVDDDVDNNFSGFDISTANAVENKKGFNLSIQKEVDRDIKNAGKIQDSFKTLVSGEGALKKFLAGLDITLSPISALVSAGSNVSVAAQKGESHLLPLAKEALLGLSLQKRGSPADVLRMTGMDKLSSAIGGLAIEAMIPAKTIGSGVRAIRRIGKITDPNLLKAGETIIKGADDAVNIIGNNLKKAFEGFNDIRPDKIKFLKSLSNLPDSILNRVQSELGENLMDISQRITVGGLREIKSLIGSIKAPSFGAEDVGKLDAIDMKKVNDVYSKLKQLLSESIENIHGKDAAEKALKAEESFSETINASRYLKSVAVEKITGLATKTGKLAEKYANRTDATARITLNKIKEASKDIEKNVNNAIDGMNSFNDWIARDKFMSGIGRAMALGGAAGAIGASIGRRGVGKGE